MSHIPCWRKGSLEISRECRLLDDELISIVIIISVPPSHSSVPLNTISSSLFTDSSASPLAARSCSSFPVPWVVSIKSSSPLMIISRPPCLNRSSNGWSYHTWFRASHLRASIFSSCCCGIVIFHQWLRCWCACSLLYAQA